MRNDDKRTSDIGASDARPPDDGLILRIAEGDTAALEVLYRQTSASVYGFALSILRDPTAAEDVMQDTFVSVMQSASSYQPSGKPMAWLLTIARNLALMRLRKRKIRIYLLMSCFMWRIRTTLIGRRKIIWCLIRCCACSRTVSGRS